MLLKRVVLIALLLFVADFFVACCRCDEYPLAQYKRCELITSNYDSTFSHYSQSVADSIKLNAYSLRLTVIHKQNTCQAKPTGLFINSALACSCDENPTGNPLDRYDTIRIYTVQDFDSGHTAGADITNYFKVINTSTSEGTIAEFVSMLNTESRFYDFGSDLILLNLIAAPDSVMARNFEVEITMTDGRNISELTQLVTLY